MKTNSILNRLLSIGTVVAMLLTVLTCGVYAASYSYDTSWSFNSGSNGKAYLDGSSNGRYYSLKAATAYLNLTDASNCATGSYTVSLYKKGTLSNTKIGSQKFTSSAGAYHSTSFDISTKSDKYYFFITGSGDYKQYAASGSFYQS